MQKYAKITIRLGSDAYCNTVYCKTLYLIRLLLSRKKYQSFTETNKKLIIKYRFKLWNLFYFYFALCVNLFLVNFD